MPGVAAVYVDEMTRSRKALDRAGVLADQFRQATDVHDAALAARDAAIVKAYAAGWSLKDIADACGLSVERVRNALKNQGVEMRSRGQAGRVR